MENGDRKANKKAMIAILALLLAVIAVLLWLLLRPVPEPERIPTGNVDVFDIVAYMSQDKLDRTIWIPNNEEPVKNVFMAEIERCEAKCIKEEESHVGIPLFMRKKRGRKTGKKKEPVCKNIFIEFILPNSVNRMLKLAATAKFSIKGKNKKIFKAGTKPDYLVVKKRVQQ